MASNSSLPSPTNAATPGLVDTADRLPGSPPEDIEIQTRHLRLAARAWGPSTGYPVLALHGWLDNAASFDRLAPLLPDLRLIALDLPGHGHSEHRPPGVHYHFVDFVEDVIATADALHWSEFALLGHSLGAGIASFVTAVAPTRITRLALIEGLGPMSGEPADGPAVLALSIEQMSRAEVKRKPTYLSTDEATLARSRAGGLAIEAAQLLTDRGTESVQEGVTWRSDPRLKFKSPLYLSEKQVLAFLERIAVPTLLICARSGYLRGREFMTARYARVSRLTRVLLDGGHHLHLENPAPTARALSDFLQST
jgi:pimeloyl-ACP methyl ester carboxylesterase